MKQLIWTEINYIRPPVLSFKRTQGAALHNRNTLAAFNRDLGNALKYHQGTPLEYVSELWYPTRIDKLFSHHEDNEKLMYTIRMFSNTTCFQ